MDVELPPVVKRQATDQAIEDWAWGLRDAKKAEDLAKEQRTSGMVRKVKRIVKYSYDPSGGQALNPPVFDSVEEAQQYFKQEMIRQWVQPVLSKYDPDLKSLATVIRTLEEMDLTAFAADVASEQVEVEG